jgi:hypothetical protein
MTLEEAHAWLESKPPEAFDFDIEWLGGEWIAYQWIGNAEEEYPQKKGAFLECVEFLKDFVDKRSATTVTTSHETD